MKIVFITYIQSASLAGGGKSLARLLLEGLVRQWQGVELEVFLYEKPVDQGTVLSLISEEIASKINPTLITTSDYSIGHSLTDLIFISKTQNLIRSINADLYYPMPC